MSKERWVYDNGKLVEKITTINYSDGSKEDIHQKAEHHWYGNSATDITHRVKTTK